MRVAKAITLFITIFIACSGYASSVSRSTISGNALSMDGYMDYVMIPDDPAFDIYRSFTIELWYKPTTLSYGLFFEKYALAEEDKQFIFVGGAPWGYAYNWSPVEYVKSSVVLTTNTWYHIVFTYTNGTTGTIYIDGVQTGTVTGTASDIQDSTGPVFIGRDYIRSSSTTTLNGVLDEMRFYNIALDSSDIQQSYNDGVNGIKSTVSRNGLMAEWTFDEGTGVTAGDTSGYANDGTFGTADSSPTWVLIPEPISLILFCLTIAGSILRKMRS